MTNPAGEVDELPRPPKLLPGYFVLESLGPLPGSTGQAQLARIETAVKVNTPERPYAVANEYIAARLAYAIGLPIPPGELVTVQGKPGFVCLMFRPEGESLPPVIADRLAAEEPKFCTGVVLFDMWIRNSIDRHEANLAYDPKSGPMLFDHDIALLGDRWGKAVDELANAIEQPCADRQHCLVGELTTLDHVHTWAKRIKSLPLDLIKDTVFKVFRLNLISAAERDELIRFLAFRQKRMLSYVGRSRELFGNVRKWPLFVEPHEAGES